MTLNWEELMGNFFFLGGGDVIFPSAKGLRTPFQNTLETTASGLNASGLMYIEALDNSTIGLCLQRCALLCHSLNIKTKIKTRAHVDKMHPGSCASKLQTIVPQSCVYSTVLLCHSLKIKRNFEGAMSLLKLNEGT